jgi:hypothetical protein
MAGRSGGPAQARRRARRAAARVAAKKEQAVREILLDPEAFAAAVGWTPEEVETFDFDALSALRDVFTTVTDIPAPPEKPDWVDDEDLYAARLTEFAGSNSNPRCHDCGHTASMHGGKKGDGSCFANGCSCDAFAKTATAAADTVESIETAWAEAYVVDAMRDYAQITWGNNGTTWANGTSTMTFTMNDFTLVPFQGAEDPDIPDAHQKKEVLPRKRPTPQVAAPADPSGPQPGQDDEDSEQTLAWTATLAPEGAPTDDGRIFAPNAISWRDLPLSLGVMQDTPHADVVTAAPVCGRIDQIQREGNLITASGVFSPNELGRETARQVANGELRGVSVDIAVARMEIAWRSQILSKDGAWTGGDAPPAEDEESPDLLDILFDPSPDDQVMFVVWDGIIGSVTICPFPAFSEASIKPASSLVAAASDVIWTVQQQHAMTIVAHAVETLAASAVEELEAPSIAAPTRPPAEWFVNPELTELTALTLRDDGHIYGHLAGWDVCHIGIPGVCTTAPHSITGYAYFHLKEVQCEQGERVSVGTITLGTGHADRRLGRLDAASHYDNTGSAVADIVCGEDEFGIWYAGAIRPELGETTIRALRGAAVSGDWRGVNGNLEMVALLAVNVPGFPVPKVGAELLASGDTFEITALTAAGIHAGADGLTRWEEDQFEALRSLQDGSWEALGALVGEA